MWQAHQLTVNDNQKVLMASAVDQLLLLINSLLSNPDNDINYMRYTSVKNLASRKGL